MTTDDVEAAECAMEYLLESGHRRIGVIAGDLSCSGPSRLRYEGCLLALERCGLTLPDECCATARYAFQDGYDAARGFWSSRDDGHFRHVGRDGHRRHARAARPRPAHP